MYLFGLWLCMYVSSGVYAVLMPLVDWSNVCKSRGPIMISIDILIQT